MSTERTPEPPAAAPPSNRSPLPLARIVVIVLVLLLTCGGIALVVPWVKYRHNNIILREAMVRGSVTKIGARIDGRIRSVEVSTGQRVSKGQVLLLMENDHFQASRERARGELASAMGELESEKLSIKQTGRRLTLEIERVKGTIRKAKGDLEAQKSSLGRLEKQYERVASLVKTGAAAVADLDKITGDRDRALALVNSASGLLDVAESNEEKAVNELDSLKARENRLGVLEARISVARANLASAESDLDATIVRAPEEGRVLETIVNAGGSAKVGEPLLSVWIGKAWIQAWADERDLPHIQLRSSVDISFDAAPGQKMGGYVQAIGLATDKQMEPSPFPSTLHAFIRPGAMVPICIAFDDENIPVQLGLSALVGIRKGQEKAPVASGAAIGRTSTAAITNEVITKL